MALLAALVALVAAYFNGCLSGYGLGSGLGSGQGPTRAEVAAKVNEVKDRVKDSVQGPQRDRIVVQGEQCRRDGEVPTRACDVVCAEVEGAAEIEATGGAQRTVDALKACLQARGVKVQVVSE